MSSVCGNDWGELPMLGALVLARQTVDYDTFLTEDVEI